MLVVALTGGIATGKSVIAQVWEQLGCYIHESDILAHELQAPNQPAWKAIISHFGEKILNPDKTINRDALGAIVFADRQELQFLNDLLHPMVMAKKTELIEKIDQEGHYKIFVSVAALTIEAGYAGFFDKIIVVHCNKQTQLKRLIERDAIDRKKALEKINSQMSPEEKLGFADYSIDTSGSLKQTLEQAEKVYRNLMIDFELKSFEETKE
ncbi:MAG: dephospho-CoA kinase [Candidatus Aminicenantes bacterium]|nr:MAG: dephospho-CoA kinase [Candidatus Aminicenantes bacterium]